MRIRCDEAKRELVRKKRKIDFAALDDLLSLPYVEDQLLDDPEQYRVIGIAHGQLSTFVVEHKQDETGEYVWVVRAWKSTGQERDAYEEKTR